MSQFHLAQINIARMLAPIDSTILASFVAELDQINALANAAEGFVWRCKEWFEKSNGAIMAPWWVPADHIPTISEGQERLKPLQEHGPQPYAFTFHDNYPPELPAG